MFPNLPHQSHIDGHLHFWQIFDVRSRIAWGTSLAGLRCCIGYWFLGPQNSLSVSDLVVSVLNSKGYFLLKREELERRLQSSYSSWFVFENLYLILPWSGVKSVGALGGLRRTETSQDQTLSDRQTQWEAPPLAGTGEVAKSQKGKNCLAIESLFPTTYKLWPIGPLTEPH